MFEYNNISRNLTIETIEMPTSNSYTTDVSAYNDDNYENNGVVGGGIGGVGVNDAMMINYSNFMTTAAATTLYDLCNQSIYNSYNNTLYYQNCENNASNLTDNKTSPGNEISFTLPWWRQLLWSIFFGSMVIVATGGNLIVIWIVLTTKRMRTVTNYFIVNLSIADVMVSSLNVTFNYIYMLDNDWKFGDLYCKISQFIATLSISASVFTLMAISIDRYVAIMKPLQPRMSKRSNLAIAATIWIVSIIISCPMVLFFTTEDVQTSQGIRTVCYSEWPDGTTNYSQMEYIYNILFMILTYFLPIISMTATYSRVGIELWGSKAIGEYTQRQVENIKSKRRVVKMMMVVVVIFAVCWLPFHTYFIVTSYYPDLTETPYIQEIYLFIYWLAMSNSMYNPIIYCWMNSRFRFGFKMFFRWCPFVHIGNDTLNRRDNMTSRYSCSGSPDHNRIKRNDTQHSYLCPGSPKNRRISHCGVLRNSSMMYHNRELSRHSSASCKHSFMQRCSIRNCNNSHELSSIGGGKDYTKVAAIARNNTVQLRQKWTPAAAAVMGSPICGEPIANGIATNNCNDNPITNDNNHKTAHNAIITSINTPTVAAADATDAAAAAVEMEPSAIS